MEPNFTPYSNFPKYNDNKRKLNRKDYNLNNINNNVYNVNSYKINSSPKIYNYSINNNKLQDRNNKFMKDTSYTTKKLSTLNSVPDNLNNSLSKHSKLNKSSKNFYPNMKDRYIINKSGNKMYNNESDFSDSINNKIYYYKNNNYLNNSPSMERRNTYVRMSNSSKNIRRKYSNKSLKQYNNISNNLNNEFSNTVYNSNYFNGIISLKDNKINQLNRKINELTRELNEKNKENYFQCNNFYNDNLEDNKFSNFGKLNNQTRMINLLNQQNQRLKEDNTKRKKNIT